MSSCFLFMHRQLQRIPCSIEYCLISSVPDFIVLRIRLNSFSPRSRLYEVCIMMTHDFAPKTRNVCISAIENSGISSFDFMNGFEVKVVRPPSKAS